MNESNFIDYNEAQKEIEKQIIEYKNNNRIKALALAQELYSNNNKRNKELEFLIEEAQSGNWKPIVKEFLRLTDDE
jgi:hypothetical protein